MLGPLVFYLTDQYAEVILFPHFTDKVSLLGYPHTCGPPVLPPFQNCPCCLKSTFLPTLVCAFTSGVSLIDSTGVYRVPGSTSSGVYQLQGLPAPGSTSTSVHPAPGSTQHRDLPSSVVYPALGATQPRGLPSSGVYPALGSTSFSSFQPRIGGSHGALYVSPCG